MIWLDPDLLAEFRRALWCEWCHASYRAGIEAAHVRTKGMGGGSQQDTRLNLVSLCAEDHAAHHDGNRPTADDLDRIIAKREGYTVAEIRAERDRLWMLPKGSKYTPPTRRTHARSKDRLREAGTF
jgi:hypothetical protein